MLAWWLKGALRATTLIRQCTFHIRRLHLDLINPLDFIILLVLTVLWLDFNGLVVVGLVFYLEGELIVLLSNLMWMW